MQQKPHRSALVVSVAAPQDGSWLTKWETSLLPLQQIGHLTIWSEQHILGGTSRPEQINAHLNQADCIILLLSPDFFASHECFALMEQAIEHQHRGQTRVIPLLLRPSAWQDTPLASFSCLPANSRPITSWGDHDEALQTCVEGVRSLLGLPPAAVPTRRQIQATTVQQQNHVRLLGRLRRSYETLLKNSLQGATRIELGLTEKPGAVINASTLLLRVSNQEEQVLPSGTTIAQAYEEAQQELLILGAPGAGKSTLLIELALYLVAQTEANVSHLLPVIIPLSAWAMKRPPLQIWLSEQISQIYEIPRKLSDKWVSEQRFLPLLDGLDEMDEAARPACIAAINIYHHEHLEPLVVCSRLSEYDVASEKQRLALQNAVVVQPLTKEQVDTTLKQAGKPLSGLHQALKENHTLRDIATMPLMLNLLLLTYQGVSVRSLPTQKAALQKKVLQDYVERMVARKGNTERYSLEQTQKWLHWLARQMRSRNQTVFYLEHLQPDWLGDWQQQTYTWLGIQLPGVMVGALATLIIWPFLNEGIDLIRLLQVGILGSFLGGYFNRSISVDASSTDMLNHSSGRRCRKNIFHGAISVVIGLAFGLSFGLYLLPIWYTNTYTLNDWLQEGCIYGIFIGLSCWCLLSWPLFQRTPTKLTSFWHRLLPTPHVQHTFLAVSALVIGYLLAEGIEHIIYTLSDLVDPKDGLDFVTVLTFRLTKTKGPPTLRRAARSSKVSKINKQRKFTRMANINTVRQFRHDIYDCFPRGRDALFNTIDALTTETQAKSFPELSQSPWFERKWASLYEAFEDGRIDEKRLRETLARYLPKPDAGKWLWIGIDASKIARPAAVTSADRTAQYVHNLPACKKPVTYGWQFSTVVVLAEPVSSWTYLLDQQRVSSQTTAIEVAEEQLRRLMPYLPKHVIVVLDRGYDANWLWCRWSTLDIGVLGRLKSNRCLYRAAPAPTGKKGCPRKDGAKLQPKDPATHHDADGMWKGTDAKQRPVEVTWWKHMHVKDARWLDVTVLRVVRPHATNKERDPRVSWFVWMGDQQADVVQIALSYVLRFGQEHGYRFDKQCLLWEQPRLRTPEQFERWSHIVAIAHNHLVLARNLVEAQLRPWENKQRTPTPQQVRCGMHKLLACLGTPAKAPQPRGKSKGRVKGAKGKKAPRFAVIRKSPKMPQIVPS